MKVDLYITIHQNQQGVEPRTTVFREVNWAKPAARQEMARIGKFAGEEIAGLDYFIYDYYYEEGGAGYARLKARINWTNERYQSTIDRALSLGFVVVPTV